MENSWHQYELMVIFTVTFQEKALVTTFSATFPNLSFLKPCHSRFLFFCGFAYDPKKAKSKGLRTFGVACNGYYMYCLFHLLYFVFFRAHTVMLFMNIVIILIHNTIWWCVFTEIPFEIFPFEFFVMFLLSLRLEGEETLKCRCVCHPPCRKV